MHRSDRGFAVLLVNALTLLALLIHGYHPYAEDGGLYLAGIQRLLDPSLFPHSTAFVLEPTRLSLFAPSIAAMVRITHLALPQIMLTLHLATIWATLFAAWVLAAGCWPGRAARSGAVVLLACWLSLPVAGTALVLMDPYLTARSISTPCIVLALAAVLDLTSSITPTQPRSFLLLLTTSALAAAMHPLMTAYAICATIILLCLRSADPHFRWWSASVVSIAALAAAAILHITIAPESAAYTRVALTRTYWFPTQWAWYELMGLAAPLAILAFFALRNPPQRVSNAHRALAQMAVIAGATAFLIAIFFAHPASPSHLIARLQPLRIFQILYLIMVLTLGAKLGDTVLKRSPLRWAAAILLLGGPMFAAASKAFPNSPHLELPGFSRGYATSNRLGNPWLEAFLWIRDHTSKEALFALDPDYINAPGEDAQCFRPIAQRSALPDYSKDGGEASIAPDLTAAWTAGQQAQQALNSPSTTDAERRAALTPLGVSWLVLNARTATQFICPYTNSAVKVCRLP